MLGEEKRFGPKFGKRTKAQIAKVLEETKDLTGQSLRDYAAKNSINAATIYRWKQLKRADGRDRISKKTSRSSVVKADSGMKMSKSHVDGIISDLRKKISVLEEIAKFYKE